MNDSMTSSLHLLGINDLTISALRSGQLPYNQISSHSQELSLFKTRLAELLAADENEQSGESSQNIIQNTLHHDSLSRIFMDSVLASMIPAASQNQEVYEEAFIEETVEESLSTANSLSENTILSTAADTSNLSPMEVVYAAGHANNELLGKINSSTTLEERLGYVTQLRDKIITALREAGHTAHDIGRPDKISINGTLYDVVRASKGLGMEAKVQFLEIPPAAASTDMADAIFTAGGKGIELLQKISNSSDLAQRRQWAVQFRDQLVEQLNANGYTASAGNSPDNIIVNGVTYDIIRNLNAAGSTVRFQAMKVG